MCPRLVATIAAIALLGGGSIAVAASSDQPPVRGAQATPPPEPENPCLGPHRAKLRCPDIQMGTPADMYAERTPRGHVLLRATNNVKSRGKGPIMLRGRRTGRDEMKARQHIYRVKGSQLVVDTGAELYWKFIPGQGHYWKFRDAARFELWSIDSTGHRAKLVRTGPKVYYCLRDLFHTKPGRRSPRSRVFPGCNQDPRKRRGTARPSGRL